MAFTHFWNKNSGYMRMGTVATGRDIKKYCCIFLTISACLGIYGFFYYENQYTIHVDGRVVNFTGVEDFIPPFINYYPDLLVAPEHKLIGCAIPKSMSQLIINIMCLLYDEHRFLTDNNSLNDTWTTESAGNCFDCNKKDLRCFVRKTYEILKNISDYRHHFREMDGMAAHAAPLTWMCNFEKDLEKWDLLMIGSDFEERKSSSLHLANILTRQGFNETLVDKIQKDMTIGETAHSTHKSSHRQEAERQIREDPYIRDLLHKIYFFDYVVFPFKRDVLDKKYQTNFWKVPEE
ncbi:hypothetical protein B9Z55_003166 [Caenorhabditis nigoni]|uniref:Uncharacterized protein n=1 Tax=Caenorhabditis nigoni TaxID=1611254 RepID=A0A2G5VP82_9PELO|nr:hypothetical protein B9Z55_003166 [Caenorhabditis nigoni]